MIDIIIFSLIFIGIIALIFIHFYVAELEDKRLYKFIRKAYSPMPKLHITPDIIKLLKEMKNEIYVDLFANDTALAISIIPYIKPCIKLSPRDIHKSGYYEEYSILCSLAHEYAHHLSLSSKGIKTADKLKEALKDPQFELIEENNAWAIAAQILKDLFPNNRDLMVVFDKIWQNSYDSYLKLHNLYIKKIMLDNSMKSWYTKDDLKPLSYQIQEELNRVLNNFIRLNLTKGGKMRITFLNSNLNRIVEEEVVAEGLMAFYVLKNNMLQAVSKDDIIASYMATANEEIPFVVKYLADNKEKIRNVDFSLLGSGMMN